jgi:hypothetical protein
MVTRHALHVVDHHVARFRRQAAGRRIAILLTLCLPPWAAPASACPFCGVVGQSLAERRDAAAVVAVGESDGGAAADAAGFPTQRFQIHQVLRGLQPKARDRAGEMVAARVAGPVAGTAVLFATADAPPRWTALAANEAVLAHIVTAPAMTAPAAERLRWFAQRLEHPEPAIAEDAFTEFGLAPFEAVREAADAFDRKKLRGWVGEPGIDQRRRGFYGLALGLVAASVDDAAERAACLDVLHRALEAPGDDFRAGFDGLMGGILVAEGPRGLEHLDSRGLFGPDARPVDQRHLLSALRFAWENLGGSIPRDRIAAATAALLARPVVAAAAAIDLARYQAWDAVDDVANLWDTLGAEDPLVRRAVAGYLSACPTPAAREQAARIRRQNPDAFQQAVEAVALPQ